MLLGVNQGQKYFWEIAGANSDTFPETTAGEQLNPSGMRFQFLLGIIFHNLWYYLNVVLALSHHTPSALQDTTQRLHKGKEEQDPHQAGIYLPLLHKITLFSPRGQAMVWLLCAGFFTQVHPPTVLAKGNYIFKEQQ